MKVLWMKTNQENQTTFEDLQIPTENEGRGDATGLVPLTGVIFRTNQPFLALDYHNAPRRQFVIPIGGDIEVESGDGTQRTIKSGEALLADDVTGQGHKTNFLTPGASTLMLALPEGFDPSQWR